MCALSFKTKSYAIQLVSILLVWLWRTSVELMEKKEREKKNEYRNYRLLLQCSLIKRKRRGRILVSSHRSLFYFFYLYYISATSSYWRRAAAYVYAFILQCTRWLFGVFYIFFSNKTIGIAVTLSLQQWIISQYESSKDHFAL